MPRYTTARTRSQQTEFRSRVESQLRYQNELLGQIVYTLDKRMNEMQAAIDRLRSSVERNTSASDSMKTLITGLAEQIRANADDPDELNKIADDLDAQTESIVQAVQANTPQGRGVGGAGGPPQE